MNAAYHIQATCKNPDCQRSGRQTVIDIELGPKAKSRDEAIRQIREIAWTEPQYFQCKSCRRSYPYTATNLFVAEISAGSGLAIEYGKRKRTQPDVH